MSPTAPVRPAQPVDAPVLRELQRVLAEPSTALLGAALGSVSSESSPTAVPNVWQLLVSTNASNKPVGYLLAFGANGTHIAELVVDPAYRRENRATALLEWVCGSASQPVTVCVAAENRPARSLYRQCGFQVCDRTDGQFDSGDGLTLRYEPASAQL